MSIKLWGAVFDRQLETWKAAIQKWTGQDDFFMITDIRYGLFENKLNKFFPLHEFQWPLI